MEKPFISTRDKGLSISFFGKEKDGKEFATCCVQRSYLDKNNEWKRESINMFPDDLPKLASLCLGIHYDYLKEQEARKAKEAKEEEPFEF